MSKIKKYFSDVQSNISDITNFDEKKNINPSSKNKKALDDKKK